VAGPNRADPDPHPVAQGRAGDEYLESLDLSEPVSGLADADDQKLQNVPRLHRRDKEPLADDVHLGALLPRGGRRVGLGPPKPPLHLRKVIQKGVPLEDLDEEVSAGLEDRFGDPEGRPGEVDRPRVVKGPVPREVRGGVADDDVGPPSKGLDDQLQGLLGGDVGLDGGDPIDRLDREEVDPDDPAAGDLLCHLQPPAGGGPQVQDGVAPPDQPEPLVDLLELEGRPGPVPLGLGLPVEVVLLIPGHQGIFSAQGDKGLVVRPRWKITRFT